MTTNDCFRASNLVEFPQPSRPIMLEERQIGVDYEHNLLEFFSECVEEIDEKTHELVKKLSSKVGKGIPLHRLAREEFEEHPRVLDLFEKFATKYHVRRKSEENNMTERGVDFESISAQKLERFKVKTVKVGGVKEDKK